MNNSYNASWGTASGTPTGGSVVARLALGYTGVQSLVTVKASASVIDSCLNATSIQEAKNIGEVVTLIK